MVAFRFCNPTDIVFGEGQIGQLATLVEEGTRVLVLYGGGSIKKNGVYEQVMSALTHCTVIDFGGIEPNPTYETILEAAEVARRGNVQLIVAVGGGSVVDAGKFLATIVSMDAVDPWDFLAGGGVSAATLPVGVVLTLPATGSESNPVSVISHVSRRLKLPFSNEQARPRFAILDPSTMDSLDRSQLENGVVDAFTHVIEQYLTYPTNVPVQLGFSETLLNVLIAWGPRLVEKNDREAQENVMWAANQALNGLIGAGVPQDWSTHMIGHAITALYGLPHARTLTLVMPAVMRYKQDAKHDMLVRYARNVWGITEPDEAKAIEEAIARTEDFFRRMGCPVRLSEVAPITVMTDDIVGHLEAAGQTSLGERRDVGVAEVREILRLAA